jgi:hypothetical protein
MRLLPNPRLIADIVFPWIGLGKRLENVAKEHPYKGDKYRQASLKVRNTLLPFLKGGVDEEVVEEVMEELGKKVEEVVGEEGGDPVA